MLNYKTKHYCNYCEFEHEAICVNVAQRYNKEKPLYWKEDLARARTRSLVKKGLLEKLPCEVCNNKKVQGHHEWGYEGENETKVQWLCIKHHNKRH